MTRVDTGLRELGSGLGAEPAVPGSEIRRLGRRRRTLRHTALAGGAGLAAVAAVAAALTLGGPSNQVDPAGPTRSLQGQDDISGGLTPVWAQAIGADPRVVRHTMGGAGMEVSGSRFSGVIVHAAGGCVAFEPDRTGRTSDPPLALVLPPGSAPLISDAAPGAVLGDGVRLPFGTRVEFVGERWGGHDFDTACPGTVGYVRAPAGMAILGDTETSGAQGGPPRQELDAVTDFPLALGLAAKDNEKLSGPVREQAGELLEGLPPCLSRADAQPAVGEIDVVGLQYSHAGGGLNRFLRVYADEPAAIAALERWASAAAACPASENVGTRRDANDFYVILRPANGSAYPRSGWMAIRRVGPAVLNLTWESDLEATPEREELWDAEARAALATLGAKMCVFSADGCG